jgi:hypothetical protein
MKELKDSERSFLFLMTGNGALLYGICVSQNELLSVRPTLLLRHHWAGPYILFT